MSQDKTRSQKVRSTSSKYVASECCSYFSNIAIITVDMMFKSITRSKLLRRATTADADSLRQQAINQELKTAFIVQVNHYLTTKQKVGTFFDVGEDSSSGFLLYNDMVISVDCSSEDYASFMVSVVVNVDQHVGDHDHDSISHVDGVIEEIESTTTMGGGNGIRIERDEDQVVVFQHNPIWTLQPEALDSFEEKIDTFVGAVESVRDMINQQASSRQLKSRRPHQRRKPTSTTFIQRILGGRAA